MGLNTAHPPKWRCDLVNRDDKSTLETLLLGSFGLEARGSNGEPGIAHLRLEDTGE